MLLCWQSSKTNGYEAVLRCDLTPLVAVEEGVQSAQMLGLCNFSNSMYYMGAGGRSIAFCRRWS